ncbi:MAG: DUF5700 domain-containing putative Zn-dependent protease [Pyrinomonadaceae bacterium]
MKDFNFGRLFSLTLLFVTIFLFGFVKFSAQTVSADRVNVKIVTDEADAVLRILEKRENSRDITNADWQMVFSSEGYVRLKKRELSLSRPFAESDFKNFVLSENLSGKRKILYDTLSKWKEININHPAELALAYLPSTARIRAKIYPVIKPRENSFVFDIPDDPAIFLYLDPSVSKEKFENTLAHELHHIGYGSSCPSPSTTASINQLSPNRQKILKWIGAFGEGFAMLAAAGGPDVDPHLYSLPDDRLRWEKDVANFDNDLKTVERFFLDLKAGKLSDKEENEIARSFYGIQGPWYTVGWQMAVMIEKTYGRRKLIEVLCDQRKLLKTYNGAVKKYNRKNKTTLFSWKRELTTDY